ncbi:MAG: PIN domain nuclease [Actinomycetia bacterium]|nr:PIN domain nuclease [Actinomycetes bacterium]MCP4086517.1 PIN domain nuclease [Actinomycetes bacterium]
MALMFLLDTSVLTRLRAQSILQRIEELDSDGLARTSMTDLEIGFSARSADEWDRLLVALGAFRRIEVEAHHFDRAQRVQRDLAADGLRGRKVPDLLVAAVAEAASLTVLHYDADFDHIAAVTGQPTQWIVERGSID